MFESLSAHAPFRLCAPNQMSSQAHRTRLSFQYKLHDLMFISEKLQCEFNFRHNFRFKMFFFCMEDLKCKKHLHHLKFVQYACNESI